MQLILVVPVMAEVPEAQAALEALAAEAKRRGVRYGHLVADTTERERAEIIRDYCAKKRRSGRKK